MPRSKKAKDPYEPVFPGDDTKNANKSPAKTVAKEAVVDAAVLSTDGDLVDIWERRMLHPGQKPTRPIRLNTPGMHLRWINLANTGRYQRARYEEGWVPVQKEELTDEREIFGVSFTTEGFVCRGEKQQEMLMKIPEAVFKKITKAKYNDVLKSRAKIKENMQAGAANHFGDKYNQNRGDEIADSLGAFKGDIRFGSEQVEPDADDLTTIQTGLGD